MTQPAVPTPPAPRVVRKRTALRNLSAEPTERWIRATKGPVTVASTTRALLVREPGKAVSLYAVPRDDIAPDTLVPAESPLTDTDAHVNAADYYDLVVDGTVVRNAAWTYPREELSGYLGLAWDAFDHWYEEAEEVYVHPRSAHRVDALPSSRVITVSRDGIVLAHTTRPVLLFEGSLPVRYYIPEADINWELLEYSTLTTGCPYKGWATYWSLRDRDPGVPAEILWGYDQPLPEVEAIRGHWSFFNEHVDVEVDGVTEGRPVTQWTPGLRENRDGGGSGALQQIHGLPDRSRGEDGRAVTITRKDIIRKEEPPVSSTNGQPHAADVERRHPVPEDAITWEPASRWVRGYKGETVVVDSKQPRLVWEPGQAVPGYVFPAEDVRTDLLTPAADPPIGIHAGATVFYDLTVDGEVVPNAAFSYPGEVLGGHIGFEWFHRGVGQKPALDRWFEEEEEIFVHPRDPYKRVDPLRSTRRIRVEIDGKVLAESTDPVLLFETRLPTRYYLPREDVNWDLLRPIDLVTRCPYKGIAEYWSFRDGDAERENVVWSYPDPIPAAEPVRDRVAFYNEYVDIYLDDVLQERPTSIFSRR